MSKGQDKTALVTCAGQEEMKNDVIVIWSLQEEFKEKMTDMLVNTKGRCKGGRKTDPDTPRVQSDLQETRRDIGVEQQETETAGRDLDTTRREFETRTRHSGAENAGTKGEKMKPPKFR
jgi:hypothetical protein